MASVDPLFAQWLQADADRVLVTDDAAAGRWGASAVTSEKVTGLATRAGAQAEAARQLAFFARGPFAEDVHRLPGTDWAAAIGRVVTLTADRLGYGAGVDVWVLGVEADRATGLSDVAVLVALRDLS